VVSFAKAWNSRCLTIATLVLLGAVGVTSPGAIADGIPGVTMGTETGAPPEAPTDTGPELTEQGLEPYTQAMLLGYAAEEQGDYQTALINFRRALAERPGDSYALRAIANMESYIAAERREIARQQQLARLNQRVEAAVAVRDWACAAATVDEMITLVPPNSLERSRLVTYRGELSSLLDARSDISQWSSVCPG
jgi:tetratricopeptide (TPR) repeat protein